MNKRIPAIDVSLSLVMLLLSAKLAQAQPVSPFYDAVTALGPASYWPMQETAPPPGAHVETNLGSLGPLGNAYYSSTNAVPGIQGATYAGDGDTAVSFKGSPAGAFLAVPLTTNAGGVSVSGPFSVEAWVYPTNISLAAYTIASQTGPALTAGLNNGTNAAGWTLTQDYIPSQNSTVLNGWCFHVFNGAGPFGGAEVIAPTTLTASTWYHIVGVFDGSKAYIYVNGVLVSTSLPISGSFVPDNWDPLTIGCGRGLNVAQYYGGIDEVAIYTNALPAGTIANHYAAQNNPTGTTSYYSAVTNSNPWLYWRMDCPALAAPAVSAYPIATDYGTNEVFSQTVNAASGLYLSGTLPGVAGPAYAGMLFSGNSYACAFNGIGTDATATNNCLLYTNGVVKASTVFSSGIILTNLPNSLGFVNINTGITAMVWFKANPADDRFQGLIGHGDSGWRLAFDGSAGKVHWNQGAGAEIASARLYNDGNWHFAVGVYSNYNSAATGTNWLYVDGVLDTVIGVTGTNSINATNILFGGAPDYVPSGTWTPNANSSVYRNRFFSGSLAHAAFFSYALSPAQIQTLYSAANAPAAILAQPPVLITGYAASTTNITVVAIYPRIIISTSKTRKCPANIGDLKLNMSSYLCADI